jgi:hypothetical protein
MFGLDAIELARAQFGFTVAFHIIFPAFSIGLASYLAVLEGLWLVTRKSVYLDLFRYWVKIFSIGFGWAWSRASSCRISSAPIGRYSRASPARSSAPSWATKC